MNLLRYCTQLKFCSCVVVVVWWWRGTASAIVVVVLAGIIIIDRNRWGGVGRQSIGILSYSHRSDDDWQCIRCFRLFLSFFCWCCCSAVLNLKITILFILLWMGHFTLLHPASLVFNQFNSECRLAWWWRRLRDGDDDDVNLCLLDLRSSCGSPSSQLLYIYVV